MKRAGRSVPEPIPNLITTEHTEHTENEQSAVGINT